MTFVGESLGIFDAVEIVAGVEDWTLGSQVVYRDGFATLHDGDEWRAWVPPAGFDYLTIDDDVVISWVVEFISGTVEFTAAEGFDPDYGDPTVAPSASLGSFNSGGGGTVVIPSALTVVDLLEGGDSMFLRLEGTSGSAQVQQIKLRAWPPTGAPGAYVDYTDPTIYGPIPVTQARVALPLVYGAEGDVALSLAINDNDLPYTFGYTSVQEGVRNMASAAGEAETNDVPNLTTDSATIGIGSNSGARSVPKFIDGTGTIAQAGASFAGVHFKRTPPSTNPPGVEGVDWARPPTEVAGDPAGFFEEIGEGDVWWAQGRATIVSSPAASEGPAGGLLYGGESLEPYPDAAIVPWSPSLGVPDIAGPHDDLDDPMLWPWDLPEPLTEQDVNLVVFHESVVSPLLQQYVVGDGISAGFTAFELRPGIWNGTTLDPLSYYGTAAPIRYWSPVASGRVPPLRQRNRGRGRARLRAARQDSPRQRGFL